MNRTWIAIAMCGAALACGGDAPEEDVELYEENPPVVEEPPAASSEVATEFAPELEVDLAAMERRDSGLHVQTLTEGTGPEVAAGQTAVVHYTGWLPDGSSFDSSVDGEPLPFLVGAGRVIPGWDEGVAGMKVGEKRRLVIPPALGYGGPGAGDAIPPNATLVFDVELLEIQ